LRSCDGKTYRRAGGAQARNTEGAQVSDWLKDAAIIDYESLPIGDRPLHPPAPVGVSIALPGKKAAYYPWGHPDGDGNQPGSWAKARASLGQVYDSGRLLLFHNARFDIEVGERHMG